jgi:hypothetical protein
MSGTTSRGVPYVTIDDATEQVVLSSQAQAQWINGTTAATSGISITANTAGGWGSITQDWEVCAGRINLYVTATRTGATLTGPPDGNLTNNQVLTLNDHRPRRRQIGSYSGGSSAAPTEAGGECYLDTFGRWFLISLHTSAAINTGDVVHVTWDYPL